MKNFNDRTLKSIRQRLETAGVEITDRQFFNLTYKDLKKIYKQARKAYSLYEKIDNLISKSDTSVGIEKTENTVVGTF